MIVVASLINCWIDLNLSFLLAYTVFLFSQKIGTGKNRVHIISVQPVAKSADTYQIRWTESFAPLGTGTVKETHYTGIFKIKQESTKDKEQLKINPLGIMIEDFSIIEDASKQEKGEKK